MTEEMTKSNELHQSFKFDKVLETFYLVLKKPKKPMTKPFFQSVLQTFRMGGGGGTPLGPLLGPRPPMINNILGSDYQDYHEVGF